MPSALFHAALAGLIAAGLLRDMFSVRAAGVVMGLTLVPDLDSFASLLAPGLHRALLHSLFLPVLLSVLVVADYRYTGKIVSSFSRFRVASVAVFSLTFAGIGVDLFYNGVNLFYPLSDVFVEPVGSFHLSSKEGVVFFDFESLGGTREVHYATAVDPVRGEEPRDVERILPISSTGMQFIVTLTGFVVVTARILADRVR